MFTYVRAYKQSSPSNLSISYRSSFATLPMAPSRSKKKRLEAVMFNIVLLYFTISRQPKWKQLCWEWNNNRENSMWQGLISQKGSTSSVDEA